MRIGIVDTTFARVDMGAIAIDEIKKAMPNAETDRRTVPGIKDLPVACKRALDEGCDICMALGMVGGAPIDTQCGHESSLGMQQAMLQTGRHIVEVFVHENEAWSEAEFREICENRTRKHARNAIRMAEGPQALVGSAGQGLRQGKDDEGPILGGRKIRLGIVAAVFNSEITGPMKAVALEAAAAAGAEAQVLDVPGVYDMPLFAKKLLMDKNIDAVVAIGAVVKGETAHDEVIAKDTARRLGDLSLEFRKPVTLGIIGHNVTWKKAEERAEGYAQRATEAAVYLVGLLRSPGGKGGK